MAMRKNKSTKKPGPGSDSRCEILAPAGSMEKLKIVIRYGADAVYLGSNEFSLRAHAGNFTADEIEQATIYCHRHGVKLYVTVNIFAHNRDLADLENHLAILQNCGVDGLIIADSGVLRIARRIAPEIPLHVSTQANVTNLESALFWQDQGTSRVNLARELGLEEIREICTNCDIETEVFVHGALCISYSGRCLLSLYLTGRDSNQGDCAHPCRYSYSLLEEKRQGEFFPVEEDSRGTYILNSKDLCLLDRLAELVQSGVTAFKIEGRMKGVYYAGGIVRIYRAALDYLLKIKREKPGEPIILPERFRGEIEKLGTRGYTENFFDHLPAREDMLYQGARVSHRYLPVAVTAENGRDPSILVRHPLEPGERLEYLGDGLENIAFTIEVLEDERGRALSRAMPGNQVRMRSSPPLSFRKHSLIRKVA